MFDSVCRIWDTWNIQQKTVIKPTLAKPGRVSVTTCSYNSDGRLLAAGLMDGTIQVKQQPNVSPGCRSDFAWEYCSALMPCPVSEAQKVLWHLCGFCMRRRQQFPQIRRVAWHNVCRGCQFHTMADPALATPRVQQVWSVTGKFGTSAAIGAVAPPKPQLIEKQAWSYVSRAGQVSAHPSAVSLHALPLYV